MRAFLTLLVLSFCLNAYSQTVYRVSTTGSDDNDGTSWPQAFRTLQKALQTAGTGSQIWVARGTYHPDEGGDKTKGNRVASFVIEDDVLLYGGFAGTEQNLGDRNWKTNVTILSGDLAGDDAVTGSGSTLSIANNSENSLHVISNIFKGPNSTAVLDGFTVSGGNANSVGLDSYGGGFFMGASLPTPSIANCIFTGNYAMLDGGAVFDGGTPATFTNCAFVNNSAGRSGGGMYSDNASPSLANCTFSGNVAGGNGAGFAGFDGKATFFNCRFLKNITSGYGGGIAIYNALLINITNCSFWKNSASSSGGGVIISGRDVGPAWIIGCSFYGNTAEYGGAVKNDGSQTTITSSILWGDGPDEVGVLQYYTNINTSIVQGVGASACPDYANCDNVKNIDPLYVDTAAGDLHLQPCSPAIDAGNDETNTTDLDLDRKQRKVDALPNPTRIDMGAYEYQQLVTITTYYEDKDGDSYGNPAVSQQSCSGPQGYVTDNTDFNDSDPNVHLPSLTCPGDVTVNNDAGQCGAVVNYAPPVVPQANTRAVSDTFLYSGSIVQWTVPQRVTQLTVTAKGAEGGYLSGKFLGGLGASIKGDVSVAPGALIKIMVGGTPTDQGKNPSGGGGSFVTTFDNQPLVIAGGGGGGGAVDNLTKDGQVSTDGGRGGGISGGNGGTDGSGGSAGIASAGGGLQTDGVSSGFGQGGKAFIHGGAGGAASNEPGGFGGGGEGFGTAGGGGGGYSGGGGGANDPIATRDGDHAGGGGGSFNGGTNQENQSGIKNGNGLVVISYNLAPDLKVVQVSGRPSGSQFPVGTTTNKFALVQNNTDTLAYCVSRVSVNDMEKPVIICPSAQRFCYNATGNYAIPLLEARDNCPGMLGVTYQITGATTRSGTGKNAGGAFNTGSSTVIWTVKDASGNQSTCQTKVTVNTQINVSIPDVKVLSKGVEANTVYPGYTPAATITLTANASNGSGNFTYKWNTGATAKSITVFPATTTTYTVTVTDGSGCTGTASKQVKVVSVGCGGSKVSVCHGGGNSLCINKGSVADHLNHGDRLAKCGSTATQAMNETTRVSSLQEANEANAGVYPNPTKGAFTLRLTNAKAVSAQVLILDSKGGLVQSRSVGLQQGLQSLSFNLSGKAAGLYLVQLKTVSGIQTFKVFLQQ